MVRKPRPKPYLSNEFRLLNLLSAGRQYSQRELADALGVLRSTVSGLLRKFDEKGRSEEIGPSRGQGQPPYYLPRPPLVPKNIGKLFWALSFNRSVIAMVLGFRRSPPPDVMTSISGLLMIAVCTSSVCAGVLL